MGAAADEGVVDVLTVSAMASMPIEGKVSMATAVVPRVGITGVSPGRTVIPAAAD
jgi:hypothetical protein